ncbi:RGS [Acanthosepion pharaonis]|uniref:RGS n=1 Tax=Acanthosepion pharaonis TaxID=158019 RepID=A0A812EVE0_ACAPH|nr:RGS [Sepia pharaonis]
MLHLMSGFCCLVTIIWPICVHLCLYSSADSRLIESLKQKLEKRRVKISKVAESFVAYYEQYAEFDAFITTPEPSNPWVSDNIEYWDQEKTVNPKDIPPRRVKRWGFTIEEVLTDQAGVEQFSKFLDKEFSGENLKFWLACKDLKGLPLREVHSRVLDIYKEFLAPGCHNPVNVDSTIAELVRRRIENNPDRYCFDEAQVSLHSKKKKYYRSYNTDKGKKNIF